MNVRLILIVVGVLIGGLIGFLTRPQSAEIKLGPIQLEVQTDQPAAPGDAITSSQWQYIGIFGLVGGLVGFGLGFVANRRGM